VVASFFCESTSKAIKVYNKKKSLPNGSRFNPFSAAATSEFLKNAAVKILKPVTGFKVIESPTLYNLDCCCIHKEHAGSNLSSADLHRVAIHEAGHVWWQVFYVNLLKRQKKFVFILLLLNSAISPVLPRRAKINVIKSSCFKLGELSRMTFKLVRGNSFGLR